MFPPRFSSARPCDFNSIFENFLLLSHAVVLPTPGKEIALWREKMLATISHNVGNVAAFLKLPPNRVIELGAEVEI